MEVDPATGSAVANGAYASGERDFGQVDIGAAPPTPREFYIVNTGTQALILGTPAISPGPFTLDLSQFASTVSAGAYTTIIVSYAPTVQGPHSAWIEFSHNDVGTSSPFLFEVAGEGVINAPLIEVRLGGPFGPILTSGTAAGGLTNFGAVDVGNTAGPVVVYLRNLGQLDLTLSTPAMAGTHSADFALSTIAMVATLSFGQSTTFEIRFAPVAKGTKSASVTIGHNDPQTPQPFTSPVAGLGLDAAGVTFTTAPVLQAGQIEMDYATVLSATGGTAPYSFTVVSGSLPAGIVLAPDGTLSGKPTGSFGIFTFRAKVIDALLGEEERQFELGIQPQPGFIEKGGSSDSGGCAVTSSGGATAWLLLLLAARRRRRAPATPAAN
jgi:hypothetical protein